MKKVIFINLFTIISIIFILEIIIRFSNFIGLQGYDQKAFYAEKNITFSKPNKNFKVYGKNSKTDKYGFRIPLIDYQFNENKNSILILGDSVAYGVGVNEKDSFIGITRQKIKKNNLLNTAIFGHNIESYIYILKKNNLRFDNQIDKIIIFICLNDIVPYQGVVFKENITQPNNRANFFENYIKNKFSIKLNIFLRERSHLFVLLKSIFTDPVKRHYDYMNVLYKNEQNLIQFENNLNEFKKILKDNNFKFEFIMLPYAYQIKNNCKKKLLSPQNYVKKIFDKLDLKLLDYTQKFCSSSDKNELFLPFDPVHLSKYGHKFVSDLLIKDRVFIK